MKDKRKTANCLMTGLVFVWGMEYIAAKTSQTVFETMTIVSMKYMLALVIVTILKLVTRSHTPLRKKDIPVFLLCALLGEVLYFYCEYKAMDYMPVGLIAVMLAFVPVLSIVTEWILYRVKPTIKMLVGIFFCIFGVVLIIGVDLEAVFSGQFIGYLLCFGAVFCWNTYNFISEHLGDHYDKFSITFNQMVCTVLLTLPAGIAQFPGFHAFDDPKIVTAVCFQGLICSGCGFSIYVYSLKVLGSTSMAVYNNFLPITTALLGWLFLGEALAPLQIVGMAVTIAAGMLVIMEKARLQRSQEGSG